MQKMLDKGFWVDWWIGGLVELGNPYLPLNLVLLVDSYIGLIGKFAFTIKLFVDWWIGGLVYWFMGCSV
jgi:hypothetical protein